LGKGPSRSCRESSRRRREGSRGKRDVGSSATEGRRKFQNTASTSEGRYLRSSTGIARARERRKWETLRREGAVSSERETRKDRFETPAKLRIGEVKIQRGQVNRFCQRIIALDTVSHDSEMEKIGEVRYLECQKGRV
jgi:hypothetical protein